MRQLAAGATRLPGLSTALRLAERLARSRANHVAVLTYHRVDRFGARPGVSDRLISAHPDAFAEQMAVIARDYRVVSMRDLLEARRRRRRLPPSSVLITFDDAYRDFADHAWPVLRRHGLPVTVFVPTAYPDTQRRFWWDRVEAAITTSPRSGEVDTAVGRLTLAADDPRRRDAVQQAVATLKSMPHDDMLATLERLVDELGSELPVGASPVLGWDELRELEADGVDLAPHSRTHPRLDRVAVERLPEEIAGSWDDLAGQVSDPLPVFAYPDGAWSDAAVAAVDDAGFEIAFTTARGGNRLATADWLRLHRVNVGQRTNEAILRAQMLLLTRFAPSERKVGVPR